ncbi:MAG TPA: MBOAT family O-acyltransferase [Alphaproteobacteria bacterium]
MLFTEYKFFILLSTTFAFYYLPIIRSRQVEILVLASLTFYGYEQPNLLILLMLSASITATTGYLVYVSTQALCRRMAAVAGVSINLGTLIFFKYAGFLGSAFFTAATSPSGLLHQLLLLPLPIGISFYTFHGISLVIDTFNRRFALGRSEASMPSFPQHAVKTFLYITFFPQLIAGPIVKAHDFYPQIVTKYLSDIDWYSAGRALVVGYFLKCVVADNLAQQTYLIQAPYFEGISTKGLAVVLFGYSMQIFADFAGYSLIAIGLARLFGYALPQNFNFPYISQTFSEFWTRWHMSLSAWLREYLYYPFGGNRKGAFRTYINLLVVMALGGLWHGAAWSYAVWGLWHGFALVVERAFRNRWFYRSANPLLKPVRMALVFGVVTAGWLLFKLPNFSDVIDFSKALYNNRAAPTFTETILLVMLYSAPVVLYHALYLCRSGCSRIHRAFFMAEPAILGGMLAAIILAAGESDAFIYFQF